MPISFKCGSCGQGLRVKDELAGRSVKCPKCAQPSKVPEAEPQLKIVEEKAPPAAAAAAPRPRPGRGSAPRRVPLRAPPRGPESRAVLMGMAGGVGAAILGAFVWYLIAKGLHMRIGWIAWGIGAATGFGSAMLSGGRGGAAIPLIGAGCALLGWFLGEYMIYSWAFQDILLKELTGRSGKDAEALEMFRNLLASISFGDYLKASFKPMQILFVLLAVATGWGVPQKMAA